MSDYCEDCHYDRTKRHGERACPFNSLYWEFLSRHRARLAANPRMGMMYRTLEGMDSREREATLKQARSYRRRLGSL
jgi:deoxyribodipyrimidine photolyase-related protein